MTFRTFLLVSLACFVFAPQLSRAQTSEWERFPEPPVGTDTIEVLRHGGYGPLAGRTLVSVDASGRVATLARGQCPDRALLGRLGTPTFDELVDELERALESVRSEPPRPVVSDEHSSDEIIREGRLEPLCRSPVDGVDLDVTVYRDGTKERYTCVTGALLRFGDSLLQRAFDAACANRPTAVCIQRMVGGQ